VDALAVNGSLSSDSTEIKEYVMKFYSQLYLEQFSWRPKLDGFYFNFIGEDEGWLERKFEESEAYEVLRNLNGGKARALMTSHWLFFYSVGRL